MSQDSTAAAAAVAQMRRMVMEVQQDGNYALIDEFTHPDFFDHTAQPGASPRIDGVHWLMRYLHETISGLKIEIIHSISDGRIVATTKNFKGKQVKDLFGKPATQGPIEFRIMDFLTVVDGKFKDHWATVSPILDV